MSYSTLPPSFENFARDSKTEEAEGVIRESLGSKFVEIYFFWWRKKKEIVEEFFIIIYLYKSNIVIKNT